MLNIKTAGRAHRRTGGSASRWLLVSLTFAFTFGTVHQLSAQELPPARPQERRATPAPAKPRPAAKPPATLLLVVDSAARVVVDGEDLGELAANEMRRIPTGLGEHFVVATSTVESSVMVREVVTIEEPGQKVVSFELADQVRSWQRLNRFRPIGGGVLQDTKGPLQWTARDNGTSISWSNASAYCGGLRLGGSSDWRLATLDELSELYLKDAPGDPCGSTTCKIYPGFDLTNYLAWSGDRNGSSLAWFFAFHQGVRNSGPGGPLNGRALCVRRSGG